MTSFASMWTNLYWSMTTNLMCFAECNVDFIEENNIDDAKLFFSVDLIRENDFNIKCDFSNVR